jgi:Enoyl-CoA hydratase/isomerase
VPDGAAAIDHIEAEQFSPLGSAPLVTIDLADTNSVTITARLAERTQAIIVGIDRFGELPPCGTQLFDCLLTTAPNPPKPWVHVPDIGHWVDAVSERIAKTPIAAAIGTSVLRIGESASTSDALKIESTAYSALLGGDEFRRWRASCQTVLKCMDEAGPPVVFERTGDHITLTLARPRSHNPMTADMRDALWDALAAVLDDPSMPTVLLRGAGACFSTGGHLPEFGSATDLAKAHMVRTARSCAALLYELGERAEVELHGVCVGSGIEVPAAAAHRRAVAGASFQLPELAMGLMPGAGGTVTVARAIGRHRTAAMVLSGRRISARTALDWGLIHAIEARR